MAKRASIVRVMPQKTSFFDGVMSKDGIGGYNWEYDTDKKCIVRRPGTATVVTTDEAYSPIESGDTSDVAYAKGLSAVFNMPHVASRAIPGVSDNSVYATTGEVADVPRIGVYGNQVGVLLQNNSVEWVPPSGYMLEPTAALIGRNYAQVGNGNDSLGLSGTVTATQYLNGVFFAGLNSPLTWFDGTSVRAAGPAIAPLDALTTVPGTMVAGNYRYMAIRRRYSVYPETYFDGPPVNVQLLQAIGGTSTELRLMFDADNLVATELDLSQTLAFAPETREYIPLNPASPSLPQHRYYPRRVSSTLVVTATSTAGVRLAYSIDGQYIRLLPNTPVCVDNGSYITRQRVYECSADGYHSGLGSLAIGSTVSVAETVLLYRTTSATTSVSPIPPYYLLKEVLPTTAVYVDDVSDATLSTQEMYDDTATYPGLAPSVTTACCVHQQKLVVACNRDLQRPVRQASPSLVWTEPFSQIFPPDNEISFASRCTHIAGVASVNDILYVLTDGGVFYVQGDLIDPTTFTVGKLSSAYVCASAASVTVNGTLVRFVTTNGELVTISGNEISAQANVLPRDVDYAHVTSCVDTKRNRVHIFAPYSSVYTPPIYPETLTAWKVANQGVELVLDDTLGAIYSHRTVAAIGGCAYIDGYVYTATREGDLTSKIHRHDYTLPTDDGEPIEVVVQSIFEDADTPHVEKQFTRLTTFAPDAESEFTLGVQVERNWDQRTYIQSFDQEFRTGEGYAVEPYAVDPYGDANTPEIVNNLNNHKAKSLRVTFTHENALETPSISGWALEYNDSASESREN